MTNVKLLTDEELKNSVYEIVEHWVKGHDTGTQGVIYTSGNITSGILDLVHTQKRLYAEMVVGEEVPGEEDLIRNSYRYHEVVAVNYRLADQRARIK